MGQVVEVGKRRLQKTRQGVVKPLGPVALPDAMPATAKPRRRLNWLNVSFLVLVVAPTLVFGSYLAFIAPDEYVSEVRFVVRTASDDSPYLSLKPTTAPTTSTATSSAASITALGTSSAASSKPTSPTGSPGSTGTGILSGRGSVASQEAYMVADYIRGRGIIEDMGGTGLVHRLYSRPEVNWLSRLEPSASAEQAWKYWKDKVNAAIDTQSSIVTVTVRAFDGPDAHRVSQMILEKCETLVNEMSDRSRRDALNRAEAEIKKAQDRLAKAREALLLFRNSASSVNPILSATSINETVLQLVREKITLETNRDSLVGISANSPTRRLLDAQIETKAKQIAELKNQLTSQNHENSISGQIAVYENLELENQFAQALYSTSLTAFQQARFELEKKRMYIAPVVTPAMPETVTYPRVIRDTALSFVVFLCIWSMLALLVAAIRDHVDYDA